MKIAISTMLFRNRPLKDSLLEMARLGYRYVEISQFEFLVCGAGERDFVNLRDDLQTSGMKVASFFETHDLASLDEGSRQEGVARMKQTIKKSHAFGCDLVTSEMGGTPERRFSCTEAFMESVRELVPVLEETGVHLSFEPHPGDFVEQSDAAVDILREIGNKNVGYMFCVPHTFIMGDIPAKMIEYAKDLLSFVHIADSHRWDKTFFRAALPTRPAYDPMIRPHQHLIPGLGDIDFNAVFSALRKIGYDGFVTAQPFSHYDRPIEAAARTKKTIEEHLNPRT